MLIRLTSTPKCLGRARRSAQVFPHTQGYVGMDVSSKGPPRKGNRQANEEARQTKCSARSRISGDLELVRLMAQVKAKTCYLCHEAIHRNERHCDLVSHDAGKISNTDSWHAQCWIEWHHALIEKGLKNTLGQSAQLIKNAMSKGNSGIAAIAT